MFGVTKNRSRVVTISVLADSDEIVNNRHFCYFVMADRYNIHSQLEHLQSKYVGTGHSDMTKFEWLINQHRDSYASYIGHHHMMEFFAIAENESKARIKFNFIQKMLQPCGPPPDKPKDD